MKIKSTRFGQRVEKFQIQYGLSNKELAKRLGVTPSRVSFMKNTTKPHPMTLYKLSKVFDVDADFFLEQIR
jgi:transcriptional regulator with XRE-family HTH domain